MSAHLQEASLGPHLHQHWGEQRQKAMSCGALRGSGWLQGQAGGSLIGSCDVFTLTQHRSQQVVTHRRCNSGSRQFFRSSREAGVLSQSAWRSKLTATLMHTALLCIGIPPLHNTMLSLTHALCLPRGLVLPCLCDLVSSPKIRQNRVAGGHSRIAFCMTTVQT